MITLWALVCSDPETASWERAIEKVNMANSREIGGSPSHIRQQLRLFGPVLHLGSLGGCLDEPVPQEGNLFLDAYAILFELRAWATQAARLEDQMATCPFVSMGLGQKWRS